MALDNVANVETTKDKNKVRAAHARANTLSPDRRREIARKAALSRWGTLVPKAEYTGTVKIADVEIPCAVVEIRNEMLRLVVQREVVNLLTGSRKGILDRYLRAKNLQSYVPEKFKDKNLEQATYVIEMNGRRAFGYNGEDIVDICKMYLDARKAGNVLLPNQIQLADRAEIIVTSLAKLGITALIDEATGYQQVRARDALQAYLDRVLRKELAAWVKRFPDEFYEQMYRLKKWNWSGTSSRRPHVAGTYTANIVYARLGPRILGELEKLNPKTPQGYRKGKHHQWLTDEVGHPQLAQHLYAVIGLMRISDTWEQFMKSLDRAYPKQKEDQPRLFI
jgi:hypothetical protein